MRLLRLEFKSDNATKSKAIKDIVKKTLLHYESSCLILLYTKTMEMYCFSCKNIQQAKILVSKELNKKI